MTPLSLLAAILVFAILIVVHELGHFIAAKRSGVWVQEFSIGFPPRIWSTQRGETKITVGALPLGGYVLMPGENGEMLDEEGKVNPRSFAVQPANKRALILVAGVVMNLILAWVIYTGIFATQGIPRITDSRAFIQEIVHDSPAASAGLKNNDRLVSANGIALTDPDQAHTTLSNIVQNDKSGGDTVPVTLIIERQGQQMTLHIDARRHPPKGQGNIGINIYSLYTYDHPSFWQLPGLGAKRVFYDDFVLVGDGIHQVLVGTIAPSDAFSGPVGIVSATSDAAKDGIYSLANLMAFLSWNLAVFNILPIPGLDGGRLLILGVEVLRRGRRLEPTREALINLAGLGFLVSLVVIFTINDIGHILSGSR
jgi:regulator of sigma E protease